MTTQYFDPFYKRSGIRIINQLISPPLVRVADLALPKESILHYTTVSPVMNGPAEDDMLFNNIHRPIMIDHVTEIGDTKGFPRKMAVSPTTAIRNYMSKHRRFRLANTLVKGTHDANVPMVYNYGMIPLMYRYMRSPYAEYYKWWNLESAVWTKAAEIAQTSAWHQFVMCHLPVVLPSVSNLKLASSSGMTQKMLRLFDSPESWMILELWKWFGEEREFSMFNRVPEKYYDRINLIFHESGKWFVMNLGKMNSWRQASKVELDKFKLAVEQNPSLVSQLKEPNKKGLPPDQFQRRFLRLMMSLMQVRTTAPIEVTAEANGELPADKAQELENDLPEGEQQFDSQQDGVVISQTSTLPKIEPDGSIRTGSQVSRLPAEARTRNVRVDRPDDTAESYRHNPEFDRQVMEDLEQLESIARQYAEENKTLEREFPEEMKQQPHQPQLAAHAPPAPVPMLEAGIKEQCDRLANIGVISAAEYRRFMRLGQSYRDIKAPDGSSSLEQFIQINPDSLKINESPAITDIKTVVDKTMLKSSLHAFDSHYIKNIMQKDVAGAVMNLQKAGIAVTNYEVEYIDSVMGPMNMYTVSVTPIEGSSSRLRFELPVVQEDGTYTANGVKYRMRKQRGDLPIRKVAEDRVALTSYYGKAFVSRSPKRVNDYGQWLRNAIMEKGLDQADYSVLNMHPGECFDNSYPAPRIYTTLALGFRSFDVAVRTHEAQAKAAVARPATENVDPQSAITDKSVMAQKAKPVAPTAKAAPTPAAPKIVSTQYTLNFDHTKQEELYGLQAVKHFTAQRMIVVGRRAALGHGPMIPNEPLLVMDGRGMFYMAMPNGGGVHPVGLIEDLIDLDRMKSPVDFAEMKVLGRTIPIGIILGYEMGLDKLISLLRVQYRRVPAGTRVQLQPNEYSLVFADETLVFSKDDHRASMILAGFNEYHRAIRQYSVYEFDRRGIYLNVLETGGASTRYLREIDLLYQMFIDPITRELLVDMEQPTEMRDLLLRACEMLLVDQHKDEFDPEEMRIKGYERMAGAVYSELVKAIRVHNGRSGKARTPIDLNPYAVWKNISEDPSKTQVLDINPIENLKEMEAVTYNGVGGRNSRSMTKHTRVYHQNDMGTISESTVDSSDVAINTYMSADPQLTSVRGRSRKYVLPEGNKPGTGATALLSTSALVSPGANRDDPKRVNFIGIQHTHGIACTGYRQMAVRTGYEQVIGHRTGDLFALTAKKPGVIQSMNQHGMVIKYDDGEVKGVELGRRFGAAAGLTIPHQVVTGLKVGMKFVPGDVLCYNTGFFEPDVLNPKNVVWKAGTLVNTVLLESTETLEDSAAISEKAANLLSTAITKTKFIIVSFDQVIHEMKDVGAEVESEDILCIIEDAVTAASNLFDEKSLDTLTVLGSQAPQAKMKGKIERIEVFYNGDKGDMSESLRALADKYDKDMLTRTKSIGHSGYTGSVDDRFRVDGDPLMVDTMAIKVYITGVVSAGVGDKGVFANQLKTVFGKIMTGEIKTETGEIIDAVFGMKSVADRIVESPAIIGTTTTNLMLIGKRAAEIYRS